MGILWVDDVHPFWFPMNFYSCFSFKFLTTLTSPFQSYLMHHEIFFDGRKHGEVGNLYGECMI